jgi:hypothetical protein
MCIFSNRRYYKLTLQYPNVGILLSNGQDDEETGAKKGKGPDRVLEHFDEKISWTFKSILMFNWILVMMGVAAFIVAIISAFVGTIEATVVFGALGTADVISLFKFSMDRVQRCLGDQVQVEQVKKGLATEIEFIEQLKSNSKPGDIDEVKKINREVRRSTLNSMELIQSFTKIAEPLNPEPWIRTLPIRYSNLQLDNSEMKGKVSVTAGKSFRLSGSLKNASLTKTVNITAIVIAIRPPGGTPDGGPFRFDFYIEKKKRKLLPLQSVSIGAEKTIEASARVKGKTEDILPEWYNREDWYAFMTCQTEDGCWNDDHNKYWFEVVKANPKSDKT